MDYERVKWRGLLDTAMSLRPGSIQEEEFLTQVNTSRITLMTGNKS